MGLDKLYWCRMEQKVFIWGPVYLSTGLTEWWSKCTQKKKNRNFADSVDKTSICWKWKVAEDATKLKLQLVAGLPPLLEPLLPVDQETEGGLLTCLQWNGSNVLLEELEKCLSPTQFNLATSRAAWRKETVISYFCFRLSPYVCSLLCKLWQDTGI